MTDPDISDVVLFIYREYKKSGCPGHGRMRAMGDNVSNVSKHFCDQHLLKSFVSALSTGHVSTASLTQHPSSKANLVTEASDPHSQPLCLPWKMPQ